ncbi:hypothetical protein BC831DRAFT_476347 [Entophlyctis helioformis]|nr:hypothetical protein BC831DRAFT_476347 [Entophlyctis helioformis]
MIGTYNFLRRQFYQQPIAFVSVIIGVGAPVLLGVGYPIRESMGYKASPDIPKTYPVPQRARIATVGFDD